MDHIKDPSEVQHAIQRVSSSLKRFWCIAGMVGALAQAAFGQDTLTTWLYNTPITLNTSVTGANVTTKQTNFPVLVRLTSLNAAAVFATAQASGADLRFSRSATDTAQFPYQISKYNQATQTAYIWVKPDTIRGSNSTQSIQMWWGNGAAAARSNGPAVFAPANGFVAVWHLDSAGVAGNGKETFNDATGHGYMDTGTTTIVDSPSVILDSARAFNKWNLPNTNGGTGDSIYINSLLGSPGNGAGNAVTFSAWVKPDSLDQSSHKTTVASLGNDFSVDVNSNGTANVYDTLHCAYRASTNWNLQPVYTMGAIHPPGWKHIAMIINSASSTLDTCAVYVNGALGQALGTTNATSGVMVYQTGANLSTSMVLGADCGNTGRTAFFGEICEARVENVRRSPDWLKLSYQNEQAADALTSLSAMIGTPTLSSPTNLSVGLQTNLTLSWSTSLAATSYGVQVSTAATFASTVFQQTGITISGGSTVTAAPTGLANGTLYYWRANATDIGGTSGWSSTWSFTTILMPPALSSPINGSTTPFASPALSWGTVSGAASYGLQISIVSNFSTTIFSSSGVTASSLTVSGLANSTTFYWSANATNPGGTSAWSNAWSFTTIAASPPATPILTAPANGSSNVPISLNLTWNTLATAYSYQVQVSTDGSFGSFVLLDSSITTGSRAISGLANNTQYYWRVRAKNDYGVSSWASAAFQTIIAAPAMPALASPSNASINLATSLTLSWSTVASASNYLVQVSTGSAFSTYFLQDSSLTSGSGAVAGLGNNITYYWQVRASNIGGSSVWAGTWSFTTIPLPPAMPVLGSPSNTATNQSVSPTLTWNTASGAAYYSLQVATVSTFSTTVISQSGLTSTSEAVGPLAFNVNYYWCVQAANAGGTSAWSTIWDFMTITGIPALSSPSNGSTNQPVSPTLSWGTVNGAISYSLQVSTISDFSTTMSNSTGITATSFMLSGLANNSIYYWQANAANAVGSGPWSNTWNFTTAVGAPVLSSPSNGSTNQPVSLPLSWGTVSSAASYSLQVSTNSGFTTTVSAQSGVTATSLIINGLVNNMTYYWQANAANAGGTGAWSNAWNFTTVVGTPVLSSPSNGSTNQPVSPTLSWGTVNGAISYSLQVSTISDFSTTVSNQGGVTAASMMVSGLMNNTMYYWRTNAVNTAGSSAWSGTWSFTTIVALSATPLLTLPVNGATAQNISLTLSWNTVINAATYRLQAATDSLFSNMLLDSSTLTSGSCALTGLSNFTTYYWRVLAKNAAGVSPWSSVWSFTTVSFPPSLPALSLPLNGATNQPVTITLSWTSTNNAISWFVQVSTSGSFSSFFALDSTLSSPQKALAGLTNNTSYYWRVNATSIGGGRSSWTGAWSFITAPAAPVLTTPTNGAINQPLSLNLSWTSVSGGSSYGLQASTISDFSTTVANQSGITGTTISLGGLTNSTTFYWRANASNTGGTGAWATAWSFTTIIAAPAAPILASPTNGASNQAISLSLSWGSSALAAAYEVEVSTSSGFSTTLFDQTGAALTGTLVSGLANSTTYFWRANASNVDSTNWSNVWSFTTIIQAPAMPALSSPINNAAGQLTSLTLNWGTVTGASFYEVQVSNISDFSSTIIDQSGLSGASIAVSGLSYAGEYYWRVSATNIGGTSAWSTAWNFSTVTLMQIPLSTAWNMKSFNIQPINDSASWVFGTDSGFLLVKDNAGNVYCPAAGQNDIHIAQTGQGYQVYTTVADTFKVQGTPVNIANTRIQLSTGWNMIGYLPQADDSMWHALSGINSFIVIVKNNSGHAYWPSLGIDNIGVMRVGEGYKVLMSAAASLIYPTPIPGVAKEVAISGGKHMLRLPEPRHYASHAITGNNATLLAKRVIIGGRFVPDSSEIGAFDEKDNLIGAGGVVHGLAAFAVWGKDPQTKQKDGAVGSEKISFKLWDGTQEYPLDYVPSNPANGTETRYSVDAVFLGMLSVSPGALIKKFDLAKVYPNPFRGAVKIAFDVPTINGIDEHAITLNIYDLKGRLVEQLAKGNYKAGHYTLQWNASANKTSGEGSSVYIVRMQANNFDKRMKIIQMRN